MLHLENLKKQAKQIVRWHRQAYHPVAQRIRAGLPRFRDVDDGTILATRFALSDAHELIARELGFESWQGLRAAGLGSLRPDQRRPGNEPRLLGAHPQPFVSDVEASCRFFMAKLGFTVRFKYGKPAFYALVQRDSACLNLRYVHAPVLNREVDRDLLSASIPVGDVKALYSELSERGCSHAPAAEKAALGSSAFYCSGSGRKFWSTSHSLSSRLTPRAPDVRGEYPGDIDVIWRTCSHSFRRRFQRFRSAMSRVPPSIT
jgi:hypothetical protein